MSGIPNRLWKPTRGLLPIPGDHSYPAQPDFELMCDDLPSPPRATVEADRPAGSRGSPEHLDGLLKDLDFLRDSYVFSHTPNISEAKEAFESVIAECLDLLNPPDTIEDVTCRTQFFQIVRETAVQIMGLIAKRNNLKATVDIFSNTRHRLLEKSNGYVDGLPRWSQFLSFDAPGAAKLQLHSQRHVLLNRRRGYQVLPQGGIGILRHWDAELYRFIYNIDEHDRIGMWGARFEWGSLGQHRLALGIRRFDPLIVRPSPWAKEPRFHDAEHGTRMGIEALDRWLGDALADDISIYDSIWGFVRPPPEGKYLHFGQTLFNNVWTYKDIKTRQGEEEDEEFFGFVALAGSATQASSSVLAGPPIAAGPQAASSSQAGPPAQTGHTAQPGLTSQPSSTTAAGPSAQP
uniref:MAT1-1-4 n=1 Tax=Lasiodiplodia gonubiensis TaxID=336252 RepID=A0A343JZT4_9PEZI|nr:MAT1-1-4 [Lasiodiplodia gonubiensis]